MTTFIAAPAGWRLATWVADDGGTAELNPLLGWWHRTPPAAGVILRGTPVILDGCCSEVVDPAAYFDIEVVQPGEDFYLDAWEDATARRWTMAVAYQKDQMLQTLRSNGAVRLGDCVSSPRYLAAFALIEEGLVVRAANGGLTLVQ